MKKILLLIFLFFILVLILSGALIQTSYAKNNFKTWIETRSQCALKIGKIEGFLPFSFNVYDIEYESVKVDKASFILSPLSLLNGSLYILNLHLHHVTFEGTSSDSTKWPSFPLPITLQSFTIDALDTGTIKGLSLSGKAELSSSFSLDLLVKYASYALRVGIEGDPEEQKVRVRGHATEDDKISLWIAGIYDWNAQSFSGESHGKLYTWQVDNIVLYKDSLITVDDLIQIDPNQKSLTLSSDHFQWNSLAFSKMELIGNWEEKKFTFALEEMKMKGVDFEDFPKAHLTLRGEQLKDKLQIEGELSGLGENPFLLNGEVPLDPNASLFVHLIGKGNIDPLLSFLENASLIVKGNIDMDLTIKGTYRTPEVSGDLTFEGSIESLITGALYRNVQMEFEGDGDILKLQKLHAHDFKRGHLSGSGTISWDLQNGFPFEFQILTHAYTLLALDPLTTTVDGSFTIWGNLQEVFIQGSATLVEGHFSIPNKIPTHIPTLDVVYINPLPTPKPEIKIEKKRIPVHWNLTIAIPRHLIIEGRGLISEWRGDIHLFGFQGDIKYSGKLKLVGGRFTIVGRTFDLTEGKIQINGLESKEINVDMKGDLELAAITASLLVRGSLDTAHPSFSSNPPMSTNQILSWILFNQDVSELTPFQACRLANVLVTLSGKYVGPRFFNSLKEGLGIDVFDITHCDIDSSDITFQIGKYISQGTFVGVNKSLSGDFDSLMIQMRLYRNFFLEGDYGGSLNSLTPSAGKMIFKWYKSY